MMSADQPFVPDQTISLGRGKWLLLVSLGVVFFVLLTLYASGLGVLLPNQIQNIDPVHKAQTAPQALVEVRFTPSIQISTSPSRPIGPLSVTAVMVVVWDRWKLLG